MPKMTSKEFKDKWRNIPIAPHNVDEFLLDLSNKNSGDYITQGVSFNKYDNYQMNLLKQAVLNHGSFSALVKHLLSIYFLKEQTEHLRYNTTNTGAYQAPSNKPRSLRDEIEEEERLEAEKNREKEREEARKLAELDYKKSVALEKEKVENEKVVEDRPFVNTSSKNTIPRTNIRGARRTDNPFLQNNPDA